MNRIELKGTIVQNDMKYTPKGTAITELTIAGRDNNQPFYQRATLFGRIAEIYADAPDGTPVLIDGRLQQDRWETQDGQKRSTIKIIAQDVRALMYGGKTEADTRGQTILVDGRDRVTIAGNVVREARTNARETVASVPVALNSKRNGEERTDYIDVKAFSDQDTYEAITKLEKGQGVAVVGFLATRSWEADEGTKRYATEVVASEVHPTVKVGEDTTPARVSKDVKAAVEVEFPPEEDLPF
jgi:single-strand DNA-binding protein